MSADRYEQRRRSCAKVISPYPGTAFFYTATALLTAGHVVRGLEIGDPVTMRYNGDDVIARLSDASPFPPSPTGEFPDVAVLEVDEPIGSPVALTLDAPAEGAPCISYGFPEVSDYGESLSATVAGRRYEGLSSYRLTLREINITPGWSGAPVFRDSDDAVVGLITLTRDRASEMGGRVTPTSAIAQSIVQVNDILSAVQFSHMHPDAARAISASAGSAEVAPALVASLLSTEAQRRVEFIRDLARRGEADTALKQLVDAETADVFSYLPLELRARYLRLHASILIATSDTAVSDAEALRDEANRLYPGGLGAQILDAKLAMARERSDIALKLLQGNDVEVVILRASILYGETRPEEATSAIEEILAEHEDEADLHRLLAILYLVQRRRSDASQEARKGLELAPDSTHTLFAAGVVNWFEAVPDSVIPKQVDGRPEPIHPEFLRRGPAVDAALADAEGHFRKMLAGLSHEHLKRTIEIWILGAMAMRADSAERAAAYARTLLNRANPNGGAALWAQRYGLPVDIEAWLMPIESDTQASLDDVLDAATVRLMQGNGSAAEGLLALHEARFNGTPVQSTFVMLRARAAAAQNEYDKALKLLDTLPENEGGERLREALQQQIADDAGNRETVKSHLEERYAETSNPTYLLERCELAMYEEDFQYAADHAEELVASLPTYSALRVAITALYNAHNPEKALSIYKWYVRGTSWERTEEMRRLYARSLAASGRLPDAINAARELVTTYTNARNIDELGRLLLENNDFTGIELLARDVDEAVDADAIFFLRFAGYLQDANRNEAARLWDLAIKKGVPPKAIGYAIELAHKIGREAQTGALFTEAMQHDESETGLMMRTTDQVLEILKERGRFVGDANELYRRGQIAIHMLSDQLNTPLMHSHFAVPRRNASLPQEQKTSIYTRSGVRWFARASLPENPRPMLDVTALLIAQELDILTDIEAHFQQIRVPGNLGSIIFDMSTELAPSQPERIAALHAVRQMVNDGRILVVDAGLKTGLPSTFQPGLYSQARRNNAHVVDFLPIRDMPSGVSTEPQPLDVTAVAFNARKLADGIRDEGLLTDAQHSISVQSLGNEGAEALGEYPGTGNDLFLAPGVAALLQMASLLEPTVRSRRVYITSEDLSHIDMQIGENRSRDELVNQLRALADHCRLSVDEGLYVPVPLPPNDVQLPATWLASRALLASIAGELDANDVVVIEDRYANRSLTRDDGKAIISLVDLVDIMHEAGAFTDSKYYSVRMAMRNGGLYFVEIRSDEIIYHLRNAEIRDRALTESTELKILRRYVAAVLLLRDLLAHSDGRLDERPMLSVLGTVIRNALVELLGSSSEDDHVRAAWIFEKLYSDDMPDAGVVQEGPEGVNSPDVATALLLYRALGD